MLYEIYGMVDGPDIIGQHGNSRKCLFNQCLNMFGMFFNKPINLHMTWPLCGDIFDRSCLSQYIEKYKCHNVAEINDIVKQSPYLTQMAIKYNWFQNNNIRKNIPEEWITNDNHVMINPIDNNGNGFTWDLNHSVKSDDDNYDDDDDNDDSIIDGFIKYIVFLGNNYKHITNKQIGRIIDRMGVNADESIKIVKYIHDQFSKNHYYLDHMVDRTGIELQKFIYDAAETVNNSEDVDMIKEPFVDFLVQNITIETKLGCGVITFAEYFSINIYKNHPHPLI